MEGANVLTLDHSLLLLLPFFLYAETHYRFRYFFSFLRKGEPEILADAPYRIEPGKPIPILVLLKDAHQYPVILQSIKIHLSQDGKDLRTENLLRSPLRCDSKWWWNVCEIPSGGLRGWVDIDVEFRIECKRKSLTYKNDNLRTSSKSPLKVFVSPYKLPRPQGMTLGDLHTHSNYTDDQVEYGAPLAASQQMADALGLSFFATTDHSYDLDDSTEDYLRNDPDLPKWKLLLSEIRHLNRRFKRVQIIPGEEISCRNHRNQNVHLLLFGNNGYFHGSGDSAEKWLKTWSENSIADILSRKEKDAVAYAAHPYEDVPWIQRVLLGRGNWEHADIAADNLSGLQFFNGSPHNGVADGKKVWIESLLAGRRLFVLGGNDAHGNFNRFRQIGVPFVSITESTEHLFGQIRTGVFAKRNRAESILKGIRDGAHVVTDGPVAWIIASAGKRKAFLGDELVADHIMLEVKGLSSPEFGNIKKVYVYQGIIGTDSEIVLTVDGAVGKTRFEARLPLRVDRRCYFRLELETSSEGSYDGRSHFCITNPIWVIPR